MIRLISTKASTFLPTGQFLLGPPHPVSNIRPVKFPIPSNETPAELRYRQLRELAQQKDHGFWLANNQRFEKEKMEFEQQGTNLSLYYKQYQDTSLERHRQYNRYVWKRNLQMIWPGIRAWWDEIRLRRQRRNNRVADAVCSETPDRRAEKIKSYY